MQLVSYLLAGQALDSALQHPLKHFTDNAANLGLTWVGTQKNKKNDISFPGHLIVLNKPGNEARSMNAHLISMYEPAIR